MVAVLVEAMKEQQSQIESREAAYLSKTEAFERRISELESLLEGRKNI
jgi:hypothetical protein